MMRTLLVAKINDKCLDVVIAEAIRIRHVDAALMEKRTAAKAQNQIQQYGICAGYFTPQQEPAFEQLINYGAGSVIAHTDTHSEQKVDIMSSVKNEWLSVSVDYYAGKGSFPDEMEACLTAESMEYLKRMRDFTDKNGCIFNVVYRPEQRIIALVLHAHPPKNLGE